MFDAKQFHGFSVHNSGKLNCKFHITSNPLRAKLAEIDVIDPQYVYDDRDPATYKRRLDRLANFQLAAILSEIQDLDEFEQSAEKSPDEEYQDFVREVLAERKLIVENARKLRDRGMLDFHHLIHAFAKDEDVVISTDSAEHGARIVSVDEVDTFTGPIVRVSFQFVSFNGHNFVFTRENKIIRYFKGDATFAELGLRPMTDADRARFLARGKEYKRLNEKPSYMRYGGSLVRRGYWNDTRYRADGRIMIDVRSFRVMDQNYSKFYGSMGDGERPVDITKEETQVYCSPYVYGFSFVAKTWGEMLIDQMSEIEFREDAFDQLVLDEDRKELINALVQTKVNFSDFIDGKGGGISFLLAGTPGIGKTFTAEAISEKLHRPLYMVSAGELGVTPEELEARLRDILDMATTWTANVLIDEADVFLKQRDEKDVHRNAMVSIFLRLLEYYQGVLFLTTNRVSDIDDAFFSRISIGLNYPDLDNGSRYAIWKNHTAGKGMHRLDLVELSKHKINGRQIKNCVRNALALAKFEKREVTMRDIERAIQMTTDFEQGKTS